MNETTTTGFLDRTLGRLRKGWRSIAGKSFDETVANLRPDLPDEDLDRLRAQMQACLETRGGEVTARANAAALGHAYLALNRAGRGRFLEVLARDFDIDRQAVDAAAVRMMSAEGEEARLEAERHLRKVLEAPRVRLLTLFNALPDGVKFLVDMRAELLPLARTDPALQALGRDLKRLLKTWFDVDFLELRRITWDSAPAALLEKLIAYEAVHAIESWDDLKNRLDSDRRCFAYFHPRMPDEPLIFVEVALVNGMAVNVQDLLNERAPVQDPASADTAIFYSISNAQKGLAGISFGNFLIKRVVASLSDEFKGLKVFATLSPVPGFRSWLMRRLSQEFGEDFSPEVMIDQMNRPGWPGWYEDEGAAQMLRDTFMNLCARYLAEEKRPEGDAGTGPLKALDAVAHFHLTNGARIERLNWMGDRSQKGIEQSAGIMVNYLYEFSEIEHNTEAYTSAGTVAVSLAVKSLLKRNVRNPGDLFRSIKENWPKTPDMPPDGIDR
ncbi:MAG: malonyl-CoA decarboxylase [Rhodospirillales bacterium]|nr:malonyl-CoA decarboxylase [Rhodospirillales bacterium]